jgi:hypothetical protein
MSVLYCPLQDFNTTSQLWTTAPIGQKPFLFQTPLKRQCSTLCSLVGYPASVEKKNHHDRPWTPVWVSALPLPGKAMWHQTTHDKPPLRQWPCGTLTSQVKSCHHAPWTSFVRSRQHTIHPPPHSSTRTPKTQHTTYYGRTLYTMLWTHHAGA